MDKHGMKNVRCSWRILMEGKMKLIECNEKECISVQKKKKKCLLVETT